LGGFQAEGAELFVIEGAGAFAGGAELADETLGEDAADGGGGEEGFDADVRETGDGTRGVIGVQGGEHQVTGEGGVDGDGCGLEVPNLTDHDDVGCLTQDGAEGGAKGHADILLDHDLVDAGEFVFDGVFNGDDFAVRSVDEVEAGVEGGGFAGAGGAGDEDDAVRQGDEVFKGFLVIREEAEIDEASLIRPPAVER
jgi:hypothetical protein